MGKLGEKEKHAILIADIEAKSSRVKEVIAMKEHLEIDMAPAGVVNFIYKHLNNIQEELRADIMDFVSHKSAMIQRLEEILRALKDNNSTAID